MEGGKVEVRRGTPEPAQRLHVQQRELPEGGRLAEQDVHHGDVALEEGGVGLAQLQPQCPQQGLVQALDLDDATQAESVYRKKKKKERILVLKRKVLKKRLTRRDENKCREDRQLRFGQFEIGNEFGKGERLRYQLRFR